LNISSLLPTPSPATTAAREIVVRYSSDALVNHGERSYFWSASLGRLKQIAYDAELLYVASMLHDLGLVSAFDNHLAPFEDAGGDVGWVFGAGAGWPAERRDRVKEIIVRHMWHDVDPALDAEGHLLREGTALDISRPQPRYVARGLSRRGASALPATDARHRVHCGLRGPGSPQARLRSCCRRRVGRWSATGR
jgi:hypothetical protein